MREFLRKMKNLLNIERFLNAFAPLPAEPLFESYIRFDLRNRLARFSVADRIVGSRRRQSTLYLVSKKGILTHRFCFGTSDNPGSQVWRLNANLKRGDIYLHNEPRSGNDVHVALH